MTNRRAYGQPARAKTAARDGLDFRSRSGNETWTFTDYQSSPARMRWSGVHDQRSRSTEESPGLCPSWPGLFLSAWRCRSLAPQRLAARPQRGVGCAAAVGDLDMHTDQISEAEEGKLKNYADIYERADTTHSARDASGGERKAEQRERYAQRRAKGGGKSARAVFKIERYEKLNEQSKSSEDIRREQRRLDRLYTLKILS